MKVYSLILLPVVYLRAAMPLPTMMDSVPLEP